MSVDALGLVVSVHIGCCGGQSQQETLLICLHYVIPTLSRFGFAMVLKRGLNNEQ